MFLYATAFFVARTLYPLKLLNNFLKPGKKTYFCFRLLNFSKRSLEKLSKLLDAVSITLTAQARLKKMLLFYDLVNRFPSKQWLAQEKRTDKFFIAVTQVRPKHDAPALFI